MRTSWSKGDKTFIETFKLYSTFFNCCRKVEIGFGRDEVMSTGYDLLHVDLWKQIQMYVSWSTIKDSLRYLNPHPDRPSISLLRAALEERLKPAPQEKRT